MKKTIEPVNIEVSDELIGFVNNVFDKLPKYYDRITSADIYLKSFNEKSGIENEVEVKVFLPGREVFASAKADSFEEASNKVFSKLKRQLVEAKDMDRRKNQPGAGIKDR
ncbi:MAG: ribosome-associated translation inhibitor RaiA [Bacteroidetes bacterium]|nr:ribosome-associated translation inhibitor RaiA [Bacteroidota bacterium]